MTISKDLFLAILSMDSYNHGYDAGIMNDGSNDPDGLGDASDGTAHIGNATVSYNLADADIENTSASVGFFAIAYTLGATVGEGNDTMTSGQTIISYRGTDSAPAGDLAADANHGQPLGGGDYFTPQTALSIDFLNVAA